MKFQTTNVGLVSTQGRKTGKSVALNLKKRKSQLTCKIRTFVNFPRELSSQGNYVLRNLTKEIYHEHLWQQESDETSFQVGKIIQLNF